VAELTNVEVEQSAFKLEWMEQPWDDVKRAGKWLMDLEYRYRPDVVHLNGYAHGTVPFTAPVVMVAHSCVASWWEAVKGEAAPAEWDRYRREVTAGLYDADVVVAPTAAMLAALRRHYGPVPHGRVIANGVNAGRFTRAAKEPAVLAAGRVWDEAKNVGTLARAAKDLAWPVCVAGDETCPDGRGQRFENVKLLGRLSAAEMAAWYARAAIYALPARYEPFGLSAVEAGLSGCALVLGDIPSLREVWGDAATFVRPDDEDGLRRAIGELIGDPLKRERMARAATERARTYSASEMGGRYLATYANVVARRRGIGRGAAADDAMVAGVGTQLG
jgi:glycogen(starch) synthase